MKITKYLISALIGLFAFNVAINAYECTYDARFPNNVAKTGSFKVDENKIEVDGKSFDWILDYNLNSNLSESELIKKLDNKCPAYLYVCSHLTTWTDFIIDGVTTLDRYSFIIDGDLINSFSKQIRIEHTMSHGFAYYLTNVFQKDCVIASINEEKTTGEIASGLFFCDYYDKRIQTIKSLNCKGEGSNCDFSEIVPYNNLKNELQNWCNTVTKYADYVNPCLKQCLKLSDEIVLLEDKTNESYKCGFSERLIHWIANIIRWVKYLIPVIVIILGILDFIKAMSSDKEDEMKKAQQKFIKRLIAAALIFIIPFIIEFVINKMGFNANGCGIINL